MNKHLLAGWVCVISAAGVADPAKSAVKFGAFVDAYYGYDSAAPRGDRAFTTQASRQNEIAVNLAYVDARLDGENVHGRLALQTGTSVYANYSGERRYAAAGAPELADLLRHLQEAYGGYRLGEGCWIDAGIFFSHIGYETFISRDNWNYTRSLSGDLSPYYQSGVRLTKVWNPEWATQLHVMNGWQNAIETNTDKAVGVQVSFTPNETWSLIYNNFVGRERDVRLFNDLIFKLKVTSALSLALSFDLGWQKKGPTGTSAWHGETVFAQYRFSEAIALGARVEHFHDPDQVVAVTSTPNGFQTGGASLNVDWGPDPAFLFRNEVRFLSSRDAVFPGASTFQNSSVLFVTSLAVTL